MQERSAIFFDYNVLAVIFQTSVMPNAPLADENYQRRFMVTVAADGLVESSYSFTREDYRRIVDLCLAYKFFVKFRVLKYFLYYVQIEHDLKAADFLAKWIEKASRSNFYYPISHRIWHDLLKCDNSAVGSKDWLMVRWNDEQANFLFDDIEALHAEIIQFCEREHGVELKGSAISAVLQANGAIMPKKMSGVAHKNLLEA